MRRENLKTARTEISHELAGCERALDLGLISTMRMSARMLEARLAMGANICVRNDLIQRVGGMITADLARRNEIIKVHSELAQIGEKLGLEPTMTGDGGSKQDNFVQPMGFRIVGDEAAAA